MLPGPILLSDPLPAGWRRCSTLGCGEPAGHGPPCIPEAVMHGRACVVCGSRTHLDIDCPVYVPPEAVPPLPLPPALPREERETARPVAGPEVDVAAELAAACCGRDGLGPDPMCPSCGIEAPRHVIVRTPGILGGAPCIAGTRVPVSALVELRRDGWTAGQIQRDGYPHVPLSTIRAALAWADAHLPEAVPPRPVAPAGRWVRRCRTHACGLAEGHAGAHETLREPPCTCSRYDGDTRCNACEGLVWQAAAAAVAGPEVDVAAEVRCTCETELAELDCPEHGGAALAWVRQYEPATMARLLAALREPAPATRAERIEAAARAFVAAGDAMRAAVERWDAVAADAAATATHAGMRALRAALCTCAAHGPDPACVEHGEALRAWQKENGT